MPFFVAVSCDYAVRMRSAVAIVAVWVNLHNEVGKLKTRLRYLEGGQNELKELLKTVNEADQQAKVSGCLEAGGST